MNNLNAVEFAKEYVVHLTQLLQSLDGSAVDRACEILLEARKNGRIIYFAGNGGSAATASHFAQDLCELGRKIGRPSFKGIGLTDNTSYITAMGNDYGFDQIFAKQLQDIFQKKDVLVAISASGNSRNLVEAVKLANEKGGVTIGLLGFDGGLLRALCNHVIHVCTEQGEYGPVEDTHMVLDHLITGYLYRCLRAENG